VRDLRAEAIQHPELAEEVESIAQALEQLNAERLALQLWLAELAQTKSANRVLARPQCSSSSGLCEIRLRSIQR
jgi:hypothetical protein